VWDRHKLRSQQVMISLLMAAAAFAVPDVANAQRKSSAMMPSVGQASIISLGGRLYDSHWSVIRRRPPPGTHPNYPASSASPKSSTWRCVSCHGWDYAGSDGHLKTRSTDAPFFSLSDLVNRNTDEIKKLLRRPSHRAVVTPLSQRELQAIALFLSKGQHNISTVIQPNGTARGNPLGGKDIYESVCRTCHGADGKEPITGEPGDRSSLGWMARNRPAQTVHKIRNGVPNADMLSLRFLELKQIGDLLAYLQRLDRK
jgi:cytochrome c5